MPTNPPRELTKQEIVNIWEKRAEGLLYRHASVLAAFLAGCILGYAVGVW